MEKPNGNKDERGRKTTRENEAAGKTEENPRLKRIWRQEEWPHCAGYRTVKLNF